MQLQGRGYGNFTVHMFNPSIYFTFLQLHFYNLFIHTFVLFLHIVGELSYFTHAAFSIQHIILQQLPFCPQRWDGMFLVMLLSAP
jgi:hypothetical protein